MSPKKPAFEEFVTKAKEVFAAVPDEFRAGIADLVIEKEAKRHPSLPEIFTLGECASDPLPYATAEDPLVSTVHLYYGSFVGCSRREDGFDWDHEIWETITHEIRHHIEDRAGIKHLAFEDEVQDHNFNRREGRPFHPFFYRAGEPVEAGTFEVDGDVFVEVTLKRGSPEAEPGRKLKLVFEGETDEVEVPEGLEPGKPVYVPVAEFEDGAELIAVFVLRKGGLFKR